MCREANGGRVEAAAAAVEERAQEGGGRALVRRQPSSVMDGLYCGSWTDGYMVAFWVCQFFSYAMEV